MIDPATASMIISALGALAGGASSLLGKKRPERTTQLQRFTPQQQQMFNQVGQMGLEGLQNPMKGFEPIAQNARSMFQTQTAPTIAERFTSMGEGSQRGSAFQGMMETEGSDLENQLAALGSQYGLQNMGLMQQLLGLGLTPQFESIYQPSQLGSAQAFGGSLFSQSMPSMFSSLNMMGQNRNMANMQTSKNQQLDKILGFLKDNPNANINAFQNFI